MPAKKVERIPVRIAPRKQFIAEKRRIVEDYEQRYGMSSAEMAELVDNNAIVHTIEMIKWYHAYDGLKFFLETTPTTGTPGTTTETFTAKQRRSCKTNQATSGENAL